MKQLLIILFSLSLYSVSAQDFFQRTYGGPGSEFGRGVVQTQDGGYACVGSTNSYSDGSSNVYLIKLDEFGDYIWGRNLGQEGKIDWGMDIVEDSQGNLIIAGYSNNTQNSDYQGLVLKLSSTGQVLWSEYYGEADWDFLESIAVDEQDNLYVCGNIFRENSQQGWIAKISADGELVWEETISDEGNVFITGISACSEFVGFVGYRQDVLSQFNSFLSGSYDQEGNETWLEVQDNWGNIQSGRCSCNSESVIVSGSTYLSSDDTDFYLVMQDAATGD